MPAMTSRRRNQRVKPPLAKIVGGAVTGYAALFGAVALLASSHWALPQTTWSAIGSVSTATAAVVGVWTLISLRQDSLDRTRPVIIAEFQQNVLADAVELLVRNVGPSVAKNVKFIFDPELPALGGAQAKEKAAYYVQRRYSRTIPTFGPGMVRHDVYRFGPDSEDDGSPDHFTLTVDYDDAHGRHYSDSYEMSVMTVRDTSRANPSGDQPDVLGRRITRAVEAIARGVGRR